MKKWDFNEEMTAVFADAAQKAFSSLQENHRERFYYFAFIFDEGMTPYISAWSYEAYERSVIDNNVSDEDKYWWKWNYADSPYAVYGFDEFFGEVSELLSKRDESLSEDELYEVEWYVRMASMEEALKRLDENGLFGSGEDRKNVVINVEQAPPDGHEAERALRLNPASELLSEYLDTCEEEA